MFRFATGLLLVADARRMAHQSTQDVTAGVLVSAPVGYDEQSFNLKVDNTCCRYCYALDSRFLPRSSISWTAGSMATTSVYVIKTSDTIDNAKVVQHAVQLNDLDDNTGQDGHGKDEQDGKVGMGNMGFGKMDMGMGKMDMAWAR